MKIFKCNCRSSNEDFMEIDSFDDNNLCFAGFSLEGSEESHHDTAIILNRGDVEDLMKALTKSLEKPSTA